MQQTINKYAHLDYETLHKLKISIAEYWYLDMVYQLSRDGWCWKSLSTVATDMRMTKRGVAIMRDRLIERGLIKKNRLGHVKTEVAYNSVLLLDKKAYNSVHKSYNSVPLSVELSATKNNNENNKDNRGVENRGMGYKAALAAKEALIKRRSLRA